MYFNVIIYVTLVRMSYFMRKWTINLSSDRIPLLITPSWGWHRLDKAANEREKEFIEDINCPPSWLPVHGIDRKDFRGSISRRPLFCRGREKNKSHPLLVFLRFWPVWYYLLRLYGRYPVLIKHYEAPRDRTSTETDYEHTGYTLNVKNTILKK